jgi:hypothetical protein
MGGVLVRNDEVVGSIPTSSTIDSTTCKPRRSATVSLEKSDTIAILFTNALSVPCFDGSQIRVMSGGSDARSRLLDAVQVSIWITAGSDDA